MLFPPFIPYESGHLLIKAGSDCYVFVCPRHGAFAARTQRGDEVALLPHLLIYAMIPEVTCSLCSRKIGHRVADAARGQRIIAQIVSDTPQIAYKDYVNPLTH